MKFAARLSALILAFAIGVVSSIAAVLDLPLLSTWPDYPRDYATGGIAARGDYAYIISGSVLTVMDVRDFRNPVRAGSCNIPLNGDSFGSIAVLGNFAYVGKAGPGGVAVFNIANPLAPTFVTNWIPTSGGGPIIVSSNRVYAGTGSQGVAVLNFESGAPVVEAQIPMPGDGVLGLALVGNKLYTANRNQGVAGDLTFSQPDIVGIAATSNAVFTTGPTGLRILSPAGQLLGARHLTNATTITVAGDLAYVNVPNAFAFLSVSNLNEPQIITSLYTPETNRFTTVSGNRLYLAARDLVIVDITPPLNIAVRGLGAVGGAVLAAAIQNNIAYISDTTGLTSLDISDPVRPRVLGATYSSIPYSTIKAQGGFVFGFWYNNVPWSGSNPYYFSLADVKNPGRPVWLNHQIGVTHAAASSNLVALTISRPAWWGIELWDYATRGAPVLLSVIEKETAAAFGGNLLATSGSRGLRIYNISNPAFPVQIAFIQDERTPYSEIGAPVAFQGNFLFTTRSVLDLNGPWGPAIGPSGIYGAAESLISGGTALCGADYGSFIRLVDVSAPYSFRLIADPKLNKPLKIAAIGLSSQIIAAPAPGGGLEIFRITPAKLSLPSFSDAPPVTGQSLVIPWKSEGISGPQWELSLRNSNGTSMPLSATAVEELPGQWRALWSVPLNLASACGYSIMIKDRISGAEGVTASFCIEKPPRLEITALNGSVLLRWAEQYAAFQLQSATNVLGPWSPVTGQASSANGNREYRPGSTPATAFFRLAH